METRTYLYLNLEKVSSRSGDEYGEELKLCALLSGEFYTGINSKKKVDFYIAKGITEEVLDGLGYENRYSFVVPKEEAKDFHPGQTADIIVNGKKFGVVRKASPKCYRR